MSTLSPKRSTVRFWCLVFAALGTGALCLLRILSLESGHDTDFRLFHEAARRLLTDPSTLYDLQTVATGTGWVYPPAGILLFLPLASLPQSTAHLLFSTASVALYAMALWMFLARSCVRTTANRMSSLVAVLAALSASPVYECVAQGQVNLLNTALLVFAWVLLERRWPSAAAVLVAAGAWLKMYGAVVALALLGHNAAKRLALFIVVAVAGIMILALPAVPLSLYLTYMDQVSGRLAAATFAHYTNQGLVAFLICRHEAR